MTNNTKHGWAPGGWLRNPASPPKGQCSVYGDAQNPNAVSGSDVTPHGRWGSREASVAGTGQAASRAAGFALGTWEGSHWHPGVCPRDTGRQPREGAVSHVSVGIFLVTSYRTGLSKKKKKKKDLIGSCNWNHIILKNCLQTRRVWGFTRGQWDSDFLSPLPQLSG